MSKDKTSLFDIKEIDKKLTQDILKEVFESLKERGYEPVNQIKMLEIKFKKLIVLK